MVNSPLVSIAGKRVQKAFEQGGPCGLIQRDALLIKSPYTTSEGS